jgi:hypothetical protein
MSPDDLDELIKRLQADIPSDVLEIMLQEATATQTTMSGGVFADAEEGTYRSHTHYGWFLAREHEGKTYLLIEDRADELHAIECGEQSEVEFWSRLLGMNTEAEDNTPPDAPEDEHRDDEEGNEVRVMRGGTITGRLTISSGPSITLGEYCEEDHPS